MTRTSEPTVPPAADAELLQRFVACRDEASFSALVARHGPMVLGVCRRILRDPSDAEDAFQAAFLLLAVKAKKVREPNLLGSWLYGAATRVALNSRRSAGRRVVQEKRLMRILRPRYRDETQDADLRMMLDEQINRLPEKLKRVIICCHMEGLTKREAAERLNVNDSTIMDRLKQAREILKRRLGAYGAQLTETSLGMILVAVAVPAALASGTAKAATIAASGKVAVASAATGKAAGTAKGASNVVLVAKAKLAASLLLAGGMAVTGATVVKPLVIAAPAVTPIVPALVVVEPLQPHQPTAMEKKSTRMRRLVLAIIMYANRRKGQRLPPDLHALNCDDPTIEYFGQGIAGGLRFKSDTAIIAERPAPDYKGPIIVGFIDGHTEALPQVRALGIIAHSQKLIQAAAALQKPLAPPTTRNAPQAVLPPEIRAALQHNADGISPIDVSWTKTGFSALDQADAIKKLHVGANFFKGVQRRVIWQSGKWYDWTESASGKTEDSAFDGTSWSHVLTTKPPRLDSLSADEIFSEDNVLEAGYLDRAGIHLPSNGAEMKTHAAASMILAKLNAGAVLTALGPSTANGHPCVRLTINNADENYPAPDLPPDQTVIYDVDPALNYAIRHIERRVDGQLQELQDNDQFQQLQDNTIWLPNELVARFYRDRSGSGALLAEAPIGERFELKELKQQIVGSDQFVLKLQPGTVVAVDAPTMSTAPKIETAAQTGVLAGVQTAPPDVESSSWRWIVAGVAGIGAIALVTLGIRRYRATR